MSHVLRSILPALLLVALTGCTSNPATGRNQFLTLSTDQEVAIGTEAMPGLIQEYGGEAQASELRGYVTNVGLNLSEHVEEDYAGLPWEFTVLRSEVINAFALPGGKVFITEGLLSRFRNEAQVAGVLGHEIGHVTAQHVDERLSRAMLLESTLQVVGAVSNSAIISTGAGLFANGYLLKFGRDQESEADTLGIKYMTAAGYDPYGMIEVLEVLAAADAGGSQPEFLSTHPHPETRLDTVGKLLSGPYKYTQGNAEYGKYGRRFQREALPYLPAPPSQASLGVLGDPVSWCAHCAAAGK